MTIQLVPAAPGTLLLTLDSKNEHGFRTTPVYAFCLNPDDKGSILEGEARLSPITIHGARRMVNSAIMTEVEGLFICDPHDPVTYNDPDDWVKAATKRAKKMGSATDAKPVAQAEPEEEPVEEAEPEEEATGTSPITWTSKSLKNNSFWRYTDDETDFVFTVPGGEHLPKADDACQKIKRDELVAAKKNEDIEEVEFMAVLDWDFSGEGPEDEEEPELEPDYDDLI